MGYIWQYSVFIRKIQINGGAAAWKLQSLRHTFHRTFSHAEVLTWKKLNLICKQTDGKGFNFAIISFPRRLNIFWGLLAIYFIANYLCIFFALYTGVRECLFFPGFSFLLYHFPYDLFHLQLWEKRSGITLQHVEEGESGLYFKHLASLLAENRDTCSFTLPTPPLTHIGVSAPFQ